MATAAIFLLLTLGLFSTLVHHPIPPASACPDVPIMTVDAACVKATGTQLMYELCKDALHDVTYVSNAVDLYALMGAKRALVSYDSTARAADALRGNASLPGHDRDAYASCEESYRDATDTMDRVVAALVGCRFTDGDDGLGQVYRDGVAQVEGCRDSVMKLPASPIYARSLVDRNLAVLAYFLGKLLGVQ